MRKKGRKKGRKKERKKEINDSSKSEWPSSSIADVLP